MVVSLSDDVMAECRELDVLVSGLDADAWGRRTAFFDWTVRDQIMHLHQVDKFGLISLRDPDAFAQTFSQVRAGQAQGIELSEQARRAFAGWSSAELLVRWRETYELIVECFRAADPKARMKWFGPDMSVVSFASARQMEVWAHGQDIYDLLKLDREPKDRIRNVCELGVRTFGWSFRNRKLDAPPAPAVELIAPSGVKWTWPGADPNSGSVSGSALDFALVVTQRRAPEDTGLAPVGEAAQAWLPIAQCFAGAPQEPAAAGSRPLLGPSAAG